MNNRLESLLKFYEKDKEDPFLLYGIALEYLSHNNNAEAEKFFEELVARFPDYVPTYLKFSKLKSIQKEVEKAKALLVIGIEKAKQQKDFHTADEMEAKLEELD